MVTVSFEHSSTNYDRTRIVELLTSFDCLHVKQSKHYFESISRFVLFIQLSLFQLILVSLVNICRSLGIFSPLLSNGPTSVSTPTPVFCCPTPFPSLSPSLCCARQDDRDSFQLDHQTQDCNLIYGVLLPRTTYRLKFHSSLKTAALERRKQQTATQTHGEWESPRLGSFPALQSRCWWWWWWLRNHAGSPRAGRLSTLLVSFRKRVCRLGRRDKVTRHCGLTMFQLPTEDVLGRPGTISTQATAETLSFLLTIQSDAPIQRSLWKALKVRSTNQVIPTKDRHEP